MPMTYAVSWQEPNGSLGSGRLELGMDSLTLHGGNGGPAVHRAFSYSNMSALRVERASDERLGGRPTLIVDLRAGGSLRIAGVAQPGIVAELASRLAAIWPLGQKGFDGVSDH